MLSVNDLDFLEVWSWLLSIGDWDTLCCFLEEQILDFNEKVVRFVYGNRLFVNRTLLHISISLETTELIHFLLGYTSRIDYADIELCVSQLGHKKNSKFLEQMLKHYQGEVELWVCRYDLELFLGFGLVHLQEMVYDDMFELHLYPLEVEMLRSITIGYGEIDDVLLMKDRSPPPRVDLIREAAYKWFDDAWYGCTSEKIRYQGMLNAMRRVFDIVK